MRSIGLGRLAEKHPAHAGSIYIFQSAINSAKSLDDDIFRSFGINITHNGVNYYNAKIDNIVIKFVYDMRMRTINAIELYNK